MSKLNYFFLENAYLLSFHPFTSLTKMKHITPTSITRVFIAGCVICFAFPIEAPQDGVIKISRKQKLIFIIIQVICKSYVTYFYGFSRLPDKIRSDPYSFLAYLRGFFMTVTGIITIISVLYKSSDLVKILQKLHDLQKELPFGSKRINLMLFVCIVELATVYGCAALGAYYMYSMRISSLALRLSLTTAITVTTLPTVANAFLYINCINILNFYFDMIHDKLKCLPEWKNVPQIW